jgi:ketosteroid isomerase-like protein
MDERDGVIEAAENIATAIARRDVAAIRELLAPDFVHRTHGGAGVDADAFVAAIEEIPGAIIRVTLEQLEVDICGDGALVTGFQHAQVLIDGQVVDDRRGFVDWFVKHADAWRIQAAVDLPEPSPDGRA